MPRTSPLPTIINAYKTMNTYAGESPPETEVQADCKRFLALVRRKQVLDPYLRRYSWANLAQDFWLGRNGGEDEGFDPAVAPIYALARQFGETGA